MVSQYEICLPSCVLRRIAYPVEAFGFELVSRDLLLPLLTGHRYSLWQQPDLFEQVNNSQADNLQ